MTIALLYLWMFMGQLCMNLLWIYRDINKSFIDKRFTKHDYSRALIYGCVLGPFMLWFVYKIGIKMIRTKRIFAVAGNNKELFKALILGESVRWCNGQYYHMNSKGELVRDSDGSIVKKTAFAMTNLIQGPTFVLKEDGV